MKSSSLVGLALVLLSSASFAANLRPCTSEKLECTLNDATNFYHQVQLDHSTSPFSGLNEDEPSIQPDFCEIHTVLDNKKGLLFNVTLTDQSYNASVYIYNTVTHMPEKAGEPTFFLAPEKKFYYSYGKDSLVCTLKK